MCNFSEQEDLFWVWFAFFLFSLELLPMDFDFQAGIVFWTPFVNGVRMGYRTKETKHRISGVLDCRVNDRCVFAWSLGRSRYDHFRLTISSVWVHCIRNRICTTLYFFFLLSLYFFLLCILLAPQCLTSRSVQSKGRLFIHSWNLMLLCFFTAFWFRNLKPLLDPRRLIFSN